MATQPTNSPVPSESPRDLKFNAGKIDEFVTSMSKQYIDRFGSEHYTIEGLRWLAQQAIAAFGYITMDSFEDGNTLTIPNQILRLESTGEYYRWDGAFPKTVPAGSTPGTTGGIGSGAWLGVGSAVLASPQDGAGDALVAVKQPYAGSVATTQHLKNTERRSSRDFGSVGGDTANRKMELNSALASFGYDGNGVLYLDPGRHIIDAPLTNTFGVEFDGPGVIGIPDGNSSVGTPEIWQQNSYADKHKYCFGNEYMYAYYHATRTDNATPEGLLKCVLAGDSTMHGGNGEPIDYRPDVLLSEMFRLNGVPNIGVFNRAVPSTSWGDMDIISDLGANTRLLMIKYGVNDAFGPKDQRHQNMANAMRAKLTEIRSQPFGGLEWLSIILVGPNSTDDSLSMRNEEWYESIRGIYAEIAREFKCTYFDTYAYLRDSRVAAGLWLDKIVSMNNAAIHPLSEMNLWIYGRLFNEILSPSMLAKISLNSMSNLPLHVESIGISDLPLAAVFKWNTNWHQANNVNGFDFSGHAVTTRHADGFINQTVMNQANSRIQHRSKPIATNTWNKFTGKPYPLGLGNGWVDYGSNFNSAAATITLDGTIVLSGAIKSGTTAPGDAMFSLPAGVTPKGISRHIVMTGTASFAYIEIRQNGQCVVVSGVNNAFVSLEGITLQLA
ncbi:GDSL-type esterase/lipase family protein [Citrobacter europaeus]|uniref:tail fiber/spike domain-containing protein n=1 Tax=Citrobacter europaeus TaxID=1914243 RepID=UPI0039C215A0